MYLSKPPSVWVKLLYFDWIVFMLICALIGVGLLMLYGVADGDAGRWLMPQAQRLAIGLFAFLTLAFLPQKIVRWLSLPYYIFIVALLVATLLIGVEVNGAQRWLDVGPLRLQASEFAKLAIVLAIANLFDLVPSRLRSNILTVVASSIFILIPASLCFLQPDLGTTLILVLVGFITIFIAGVSWIYYLLGTIATALALLCVGFGLVSYAIDQKGVDELDYLPSALIAMYENPVSQSIGEGIRPDGWTKIGLIKNYQYQRINTFFDPTSDSRGDDYHIQQSQITLGSGGMWGRGFMQGSQSRLDFIPENETDFIFSSYAEYFGYAGTVFLLTLFGLISLALGFSTLRNKSTYGAIVTGGVAVIFFSFYMVNLSMVMGLIPVVGVPLPFISYGGSSILMLCIGLGYAQNAHINRPRGEAFES